MKTREQIEAAFNAALRSYISLDQDAPETHQELRETIETLRRTASQLAWVLNITDYPDFACADRFFNRLIACDEQALAAGAEPEE